MMENNGPNQSKQFRIIVNHQKNGASDFQTKPHIGQNMIVSILLPCLGWLKMIQDAMTNTWDSTSGPQRAQNQSEYVGKMLIWDVHGNHIW